MEQLTPQLMHKLVFTVLMHGLNDAQAGLALRLLTDALSHPNQQIRELAVVAVADLAVAPAKRVAPLATALKDEVPKVRRRAARALGDQGPAAQAALAQLTDGLSDSDPSVRRDCAGAIGRLGPAALPAAEALFPMLLDPETRTWIVASVSLRRMGSAVVPLFVDGLRHPTPAVRARCARALGKLAQDDPAVLAALRAAANDPDEEVRTKVAEALRGRVTPVTASRDWAG